MYAYVYTYTSLQYTYAHGYAYKHTYIRNHSSEQYLQSQHSSIGFFLTFSRLIFVCPFFYNENTTLSNINPFTHFQSIFLSTFHIWFHTRVSETGQVARCPVLYRRLGGFSFPSHVTLFSSMFPCTMRGRKKRRLRQEVSQQPWWEDVLGSTGFKNGAHWFWSLQISFRTTPRRPASQSSWLFGIGS